MIFRCSHLEGPSRPLLPLRLHRNGLFLALKLEPQRVECRVQQFIERGVFHVDVDRRVELHAFAFQIERQRKFLLELCKKRLQPHPFQRQRVDLLAGRMTGRACGPRRRQPFMILDRGADHDAPPDNLTWAAGARFCHSATVLAGSRPAG